MTILKRISTLLSANINLLLDKAENPEAMIKQIIRDMEESIIELRRETVKAIGQQKQLEKKIERTKGQQRDLQEKAATALERQDEALARQMIVRKLEADHALSAFEAELERAKQLAEQLKEDLGKLEDQVQIARRKKEEMVRRQRSAAAKLRIQQALQESNRAMSDFSGALSNFQQRTRSLQSYEEKIQQLEAEAEATEELLKMISDGDAAAELKKMEIHQAVEAELKRLKEKQKQHKSGKTPPKP